MGFRQRVKFFLVHQLGLENKAAQALIDAGEVEIDGSPVFDNCLLSNNAQIKVNGVIRQAKKALIYLKFNKPAGYESTFSQKTEHNLSVFFGNSESLAIAGRLDKASEGLLLLSNDGKWVESICNPKFEKEKEYEVKLNKKPDESFAAAFSKGVVIGGYKTQACQCHVMDEETVRVILTEGKNRQIRRMCRALGYEVLGLKRLRIAGVVLGDLKPAEFKQLDSPSL